MRLSGPLALKTQAATRSFVVRSLDQGSEGFLALPLLQNTVVISVLLVLLSFSSTAGLLSY